jgi:hypothetical protein
MFAVDPRGAVFLRLFRAISLELILESLLRALNPLGPLKLALGAR